MVPITTYQSMCSDVICEGQTIASPHIYDANISHSSYMQSSRLLPSSKCNAKKKPPNETIPLYFAWNRLDPSYEEADINKHSPAHRRPPPQCQIDEREMERAKTSVTPSSHHFLVDPDLVHDDEPFVTEYADKYRAWTIPVKGTKTNKGHKSNDGERGVELALRGMGMGISQTPPKTQHKKPPLASSCGTTGSSSRRQTSVIDHCTAGRESSPTSLADGAPLLITCDNRASSGTVKHELDEQSYLTGSTGATAPSTPAGGSYGEDDEVSATHIIEEGARSTRGKTMSSPMPTPPKSSLTEEGGDILLITSGNCNKNQAPKQCKPTKQNTRKLRETRRDMPFWKSSSSSLGIPRPATPNHSVSKGRARRFGEKNGIISRSARTCSSTTATCPSPQKLSKMLLTSRRGLTSSKLFPRLPNDPFRKDAFKRKV